MKRLRLRLAILALLAWLLLAGAGCCQEQFTRQKYETLYTGQPAAAVEEVLGPPETRSPDVWTYVHERPWYKAVLTFKDGRLVDRVWYSRRELDTRPGTQAPGKAKSKTANGVE